VVPVLAGVARPGLRPSSYEVTDGVSQTNPGEGAVCLSDTAIVSGQGSAFSFTFTNDGDLPKGVDEIRLLFATQNDPVPRVDPDHSGSSAEAHPFRGGRKRVRSERQTTNYDRADSPAY